MRQFSFFILFCMAAINLTGCSGNISKGSNALAGNDRESSGDAHFSAIVDGVQVTGGSIDALQQHNSAYSIPGENGSTMLLFWLFDTKDGGDEAPFTHSIRIYLPKTTGVHTITRDAFDRDKYSIGITILLDPTHSAVYYSDSITTNIKSISATRVSGTFSGKFLLSPDTPNVPAKAIKVSEGSFDLPFSTSKLIPM